MGVLPRSSAKPLRAVQTAAVSDRVWVAVEQAVRDGLDDKAVLEDPPKTQDDVMWLAATIADHVCSAMPRDVYKAFRAALEERERSSPTHRRWRFLR